MRSIKKLFNILLIILLGIFSVNAQQATSNGGEASGSGGTVSYSVGQVVYQSHDNGTNSVSEGVQQAFEISNHVGIAEASAIQLTMNVFPNPSNGLLTLCIKDYVSNDLVYQIYDQNGKQVSRGRIKGQSTQISLSQHAASTYFLNVLDANKEIKTFKIIKH